MSADKIVLWEEPTYFTKFNYHKMKLLYHRITMKLFAKRHRLEYIDFLESAKFCNKVQTYTIRMYDPFNHELETQLRKRFPHLVVYPAPQFLVSNPQEMPIKSGHLVFYKTMRRQLNVLMNKNGTPAQGKWSFDTENRNPPDGKQAPLLRGAPSSKRNDEMYRAAKRYVEQHFSENYGDLPLTAHQFPYAIDHQESALWLEEFLKKRLFFFGRYQDAIDPNQPFMFHSVLSPMMNVGLLLDSQVVRAAEKYKGKVPIASLEGFLRQVIGWRQYVYCWYVQFPKMKAQNFFGHRGKISTSYWTATTGIEPVDMCIRKIIKYSYLHHIERLMVLGNWLLITQKDPKEVYRMFMEWTIDAYEWVMVPNVFGMSQFADGGQMMKRPYFSASAYLKRMGKWQTKSWEAVWDTTFWEFVRKNASIFKKIYSTSALVSHLEKKSKRIKSESLKFITI
jgi:deoxyribodipyrimidine photolyase-related protein